MDNVGYQDALLRLAPPGLAFNRWLGSVTAAFALAVGDLFAAFDGRLTDLINEADPRTTEEMLPDWEAFAGLPDPAIPAPVTLDDRRTALAARLLSRSGVTAADFIALVATFGYAATITLHTPFAADVGTADSPLYDQPSIYWWEVNVTVPAGTTTPVVAMEHAIGRLAPDHTYPTFNYLFD